MFCHTSTSAQAPNQWGPTQNRTRGECLLFFFPSLHEAAVWPSATVAKNMCFPLEWASLSWSWWLLQLWKALVWSGWLSCVDGSSVDRPSGGCFTQMRKLPVYKLPMTNSPNSIPDHLTCNTGVMLCQGCPRAFCVENTLCPLEVDLRRILSMPRHGSKSGFSGVQKWVNMSQYPLWTHFGALTKANF